METLLLGLPTPFLPTGNQDSSELQEGDLHGHWPPPLCWVLRQVEKRMAHKETVMSPHSMSFGSSLAYSGKDSRLLLKPLPHLPLTHPSPVHMCKLADPRALRFSDSPAGLALLPLSPWYSRNAAPTRWRVINRGTPQSLPYPSAHLRGPWQGPALFSSWVAVSP